MIQRILRGFTQRVFQNGTLDQEGSEMGFLDHIDELRKRLVRSVIAIAVCSAIAMINYQFLFDSIIFGPKKADFWTYRKFCELSHWLYNDDSLCIPGVQVKNINIEVTSQMTNFFYIGFLAGVIIAFPYIVYQLWQFVKPALKEKEQKQTRGIVGSIAALFFIGVLFGYFILTPISLSFLANFTLSDEIQNMWSFDSYISFVSFSTFACGIVFELPILVYMLSRLGIIGPDLMRKYRRHAAVIILIIAAILTPSPDLASQMLMAIPLYMLYEMSIMVSARVEKRRKKSKVTSE